MTILSRFAGPGGRVLFVAATLCCVPGAAQDSEPIEEPFLALHRWRSWQAEQWRDLMLWCRARSVDDEARAASDQIRRLLPPHVAKALDDPAPLEEPSHAASTHRQRLAVLRDRIAARGAELAAALLERGLPWEAAWVARDAAATGSSAALDEVLQQAEAVLADAQAAHEVVIERAKGGQVQVGKDELGMHYAFSLPPDWDAEETYPVFFLHHGTGYDGSAAVDVAGRLALRRTCIVVGPTRERPPRWGDRRVLEADCSKLMRILCRTIVQYGGDPTRVFMVGHSWGGAICYRAAADHPEHFAGIVSIYGSFYDEGNAFPAGDRPVSLPLLVLRAEHDRFAKWLDPQRERALAALAKANYTGVTYRELAGASHDDATTALRRCGPWLREIAGRELIERQQGTNGNGR